MDDKHEVAPEELAAEQAALQEGKQEEIRANIIAEFGFDEATDAERIEKLVTKEMEHHKKLSSAIGQKINWREKASKPTQPVTPTTETAKPAESVDIDKKLDERLAQRDLDDMDVPDAIKKQVGEWARFKGITVKQAARAPHIASQITDYEKEQRTEGAAISRTNRSGGKKTYTLDNPPDVDMRTTEGQKEWADYKEALRKAGN